VEAQIIGLPVVASAVGAVGETLGPEQFVAEPPVHPADYRFYAALCHRLITDGAVRNQLILQGERNARTRFTSEAIENAFTGALYEILHAS
jgi:glycosyltransferase involved in cell wall biosynthesis